MKSAGINIMKFKIGNHDIVYHIFADMVGLKCDLSFAKQVLLFLVSCLEIVSYILSTVAKLHYGFSWSLNLSK